MRILYIIPSYNIYGGTPKKTLDLMKYFGEQSSLYVYENSYPEFKPQFEATRGRIYEGFFGRNIFKHIEILLRIIDHENINIVQTQFSMGETLGFIIKLFRPRVKLLVTFVSGIRPTLLKLLIVNQFYKKPDAFVYISNYVKKEKVKQFHILTNKTSKIIFNGTEKRADNGSEVVEMKHFSLLAVAGLIDIKNVNVLIEALNIIINTTRRRDDVFLYVAGDGPKRAELEVLILKFSLQEHVFLLGYQTNIGKLMNSCYGFVHPCYNEGFGIAVTEAMMGEKPIIIANAGALPELIQNEISGLIVEPHNADQWANAILRIIENPLFAKKIAQKAREKADHDFTSERFTKNYEQLYDTVLNF